MQPNRQPSGTQHLSESVTPYLIQARAAVRLLCCSSYGNAHASSSSIIPSCANGLNGVFHPEAQSTQVYRSGHTGTVGSSLKTLPQKTTPSLDLGPTLPPRCVVAMIQMPRIPGMSRAPVPQLQPPSPPFWSQPPLAFRAFVEHSKK